MRPNPETLRHLVELGRAQGAIERIAEEPVDPTDRLHAAQRAIENIEKNPPSGENFDRALASFQVEYQRAAERARRGEQGADDQLAKLMNFFETNLAPLLAEPKKPAERIARGKPILRSRLETDI